MADGTMAIVAPEDARDDPPSRAFLERVVDARRAGARGPLHRRASVDAQRRRPRVPAPPRAARPPTKRAPSAPASSSTTTLYDALSSWVDRHYRDRLAAGDLADPELLRESMRALDELTGILALGAVYDFQRT